MKRNASSLIVDSEHEQNTPHPSLHTTLGMSLIASSFCFLVSCMLFLLTLAHSILTFFSALPLAILSYISSQAPGKNRVLPQIPSSSPQGSAMPSVFYQPRVDELDHTASSHVTNNFQMEAVGVKQPYDAFLVLDVEATCFRGTGFDWPNEIIVRWTFTYIHRLLIIS